jgi:hypothetical protein
MTWVQWIIGIGSFLLIIPITILIVWLVRSGLKIRVPRNASEIEIDYARTRFTEGYSSGYVTDLTPCKNGTIRVTFQPTDYDQSEGSVKPTSKTFIVAKESLKIIPRGGLSARREKIKTIPRSPLDIPKEIVRTELGKNMIIEGENSFLLTNIAKIMKNSDEALASFSEQSASGKIQKMKEDEIEEEIKQLKKRLLLLDRGEGLEKR